MKNMNYLKIAAAGTAAFMISAAAGFSAMAGAFGTASTSYAVEATPEVSDVKATPEVSEYAGAVTVSADEAEDAAATSSLKCRGTGSTSRRQPMRDGTGSLWKTPPRS